MSVMASSIRLLVMSARIELIFGYVDCWWYFLWFTFLGEENLLDYLLEGDYCFIGDYCYCLLDVGERELYYVFLLLIRSGGDYD